MSRWYETAIPQEKRSFFWDDLGWFYLFMAFLFHCWTCLVAATMGDLWGTVATVFVPPEPVVNVKASPSGNTPVSCPFSSVFPCWKGIPAQSGELLGGLGLRVACSGGETH